MTYKELIQHYTKICNEENKEISAIKLLIYDHFGYNSAELYTNYDQIIEKGSLDLFDKKAHKYIYGNIPVQYIMGYTYFYNNKFKVTPDVLIPRFETELLISEIVNSVNPKLGQISILDIGTGSGVIAITLKSLISNSNVDALDISPKALDIAKENARILNVNVNFFLSDLFSKIEKNNKYDIIVSNPPYIPYEDNVEKLVFDNEPHLALFADNNGIYFYEEILKVAKEYLSKNGLIFFEIGYNQRELIENLITKYFPKSKYEFFKDFNNYDRVVKIENL